MHLRAYLQNYTIGYNQSHRSGSICALLSLLFITMTHKTNIKQHFFIPAATSAFSLAQSHAETARNWETEKKGRHFQSINGSRDRVQEAYGCIWQSENLIIFICCATHSIMNFNPSLDLWGDTISPGIHRLSKEIMSTEDNSQSQCADQHLQCPQQTHELQRQQLQTWTQITGT